MATKPMKSRKPASKPVAVKAQPAPVAPNVEVLQARDEPSAPAETAAVEAAIESVEWPVAEVPAPMIEPESKIESQDPAVVAEISSVATAIEKGPMIMTDMLETAKSYAEEAKTRFQSAFAEANDKAKSTMEKSSKAFEELGELTKGNLEAVVESSKIAAKGVETLGQEAAEFGRKSFEKTSATMKSFAAVKTPAEFFQLQSELLSSTMDSFASQASKNSEAFLKLASEITTPLSNRVSIVTERIKTLAA